MENKKQITIKIAENGCIRKPVYSLEFAKGVFMANEDGHKFLVEVHIGAKEVRV